MKKKNNKENNKENFCLGNIMPWPTVSLANICYLDIQNISVGITFGFSLCTASLLVILVTYFRRGA